MSQSPRILNITRKFHLKRRQAERAIENCACEWVEFGVSVRDLTLAEAIAKRNQQKKVIPPIEYAELRRITFRPPIEATAATRESRQLAKDAMQFYAEATA